MSHGASPNRQHLSVYLAYAWVTISVDKSVGIEEAVRFTFTLPAAFLLTPKKIIEPMLSLQKILKACLYSVSNEIENLQRSFRTEISCYCTGTAE